MLTLNISSSVWYIFLNFYGHIPGMLIHLFQIILNLYLEIQISLYFLDLTCYIFTLLSLLSVTFWDLWSCLKYIQEKVFELLKSCYTLGYIQMKLWIFYSNSFAISNFHGSDVYSSYFLYHSRFSKKGFKHNLENSLIGIKRNLQNGNRVWIFLTSDAPTVVRQGEG